MNALTRNLSALFRPVVAQRPSLAGDGSAEPVLSLLSERGWAIVDTPEANAHCSSPDGRVYVGWLPEDPDAWRRNIVWTVRAIPAEADAPFWVQEFGPHVPSRAVAAFLEALTGHVDR